MVMIHVMVQRLFRKIAVMQHAQVKQNIYLPVYFHYCLSNVTYYIYNNVREMRILVLYPVMQVLHMLWLRAIPKIIILTLIVRMERHIIDMHAVLGQSRGMEMEPYNMALLVPTIIWHQRVDIVLAAAIVELYKLNVVLVCFSNQLFNQPPLIHTISINC